ncbi:hypothetical protein [Microbacterium capsulatum]|uniref:Uncharacterized protein n=1 Tax=Microbacterium capsulatum TaxID=3041921 RepID=A0ABU0XKW0_9MICO|nr:hypothetical protein [Microbacterium sp. ASV81]MDQ4214755.1 hypothetical protein [Microbacterium sp. ASV81]
MPTTDEMDNGSPLNRGARLLIEAFAERRYSYTIGALHTFATCSEGNPIEALEALINAIGEHADAHLNEDPAYG